MSNPRSEILSIGPPRIWKPVPQILLAVFWARTPAFQSIIKILTELRQKLFLQVRADFFGIPSNVQDRLHVFRAFEMFQYLFIARHQLLPFLIEVTDTIHGLPPFLYRRIDGSDAVG